MWPRFRKWLAEKIAPPAEQLEKKADAEMASHVKGVRMPRARYLLMLLLLVICVVGYSRGWHKRLLAPASSLTPVATQGGEKNPGYAAPPVKSLAKAPKRTAQRTIQSTPVEDLPKGERGYAPVVPPAAGPDNIVRTEPELLTSSVVPPARGDTEVRTWLNPDGSAQNILTPRRESFFGWPWKDGNWKRLELEGRYGLVGNTQMKATARWLPLRLGDFQGGVEGSVAAETGGIVRTEVMGIVRFEPFRQTYR
jgi:hypothetical protein